MCARLFQRGVAKFEFAKGAFTLKPLAQRSLFPGWDEALGLCDDVVVNLRLFDRLGAMPLVVTPLQESRVPTLR